MTIHKLPIVVGVIGLGMIIASTIRWFFMYPDMSQFVLAVGLGFGVCSLAYIYNWMKETDKKLEEHEKRVDGLVKWWTKHDLIKDEKEPE